MRRIAFLFVITVLIGTIGIIVNKANELIRKESLETGWKHTNEKTIPAFGFTALDRSVFSNEDLDSEKGTIIIRFDPDCELCEKTGKVFSKFKKVHEKSNILFVSSNTLEKIGEYSKRFNLDSIENITFLRAEDEVFLKQFGELGTPTYFIYSPKGELIKIIDDDIPVKILLRYVKASQIDEKI